MGKIFDEETKTKRPYFCIREYKRMLADTDYMAIKYAEGLLTESDYSSVKAERQQWRAEINEIEAQLNAEANNG